MKLRFTPRATRDLHEISAFIRTENPNAALHVRDAIVSSLTLLTAFPTLGKDQNVEGVRKHVTRNYHYIVYYSVDHAAGEIAVLTIQHPARAQPY